jgi:hypothetical protein
MDVVNRAMWYILRCSTKNGKSTFFMCLTKHHAMKKYPGVEVKLHYPFSTFELNVREQSASRPGHYPPSLERRYSLNRRLGGPGAKWVFASADNQTLISLVIKPSAKSLQRMDYVLTYVYYATRGGMEVSSRLGTACLWVINLRLRPNYALWEWAICNHWGTWHVAGWPRNIWAHKGPRKQAGERAQSQHF